MGTVLLLATALCACSAETGGTPTPDPVTISTGQAPRNGPPDHVVGGFSIEMPSLTLEPGKQLFPCYVFPLEVDGDSRIVGGGKLFTQPGLHHGNVTTRPTTEGDGIRPCNKDNEFAFGGEAADVLNGGSVLFGSSTQIEGEEWQSFPEGMGFRIADGYEIVARLHYLNTTSETIEVAPRYEWFTIEESSVSTILGPFVWALSGWEISPLSTLTVSATCRPRGPMHVVNALPHMHQLGVELFGEYVGGEYDGVRFLDSVGYDPENGVLTQYIPAADLTLTEEFRFGCTWKNTYDKTIVEGVGDNEMCMVFGYAYPYEHAYTAKASTESCFTFAPPPVGGAE
jgi:hypothetical protein